MSTHWHASHSDQSVPSVKGIGVVPTRQDAVDRARSYAQTWKRGDSRRVLETSIDQPLAFQLVGLTEGVYGNAQAWSVWQCVSNVCVLDVTASLDEPVPFEVVGAATYDAATDTLESRVLATVRDWTDEEFRLAFGFDRT